jgi:hypothetical protein
VLRIFKIGSPKPFAWATRSSWVVRITGVSHGTWLRFCLSHLKKPKTSKKRKLSWAGGIAQCYKVCLACVRPWVQSQAPISKEQQLIDTKTEINTEEGNGRVMSHLSFPQQWPLVLPGEFPESISMWSALQPALENGNMQLLPLNVSSLAR